MDGEPRVEQVGKFDASGFCRKPEQPGVAVEGPSPIRLEHRQVRLKLAVDQHLSDPTIEMAIRQAQSRRPEPSDLDDCDCFARYETCDHGVRSQVFKCHCHTRALPTIQIL